MSQAEWAVPAERAAAPGPDSGWCSSGGARPVDSEEPGSGGSCGRPPGQQRQAEKAGPGYDLAFPDLGGVPAVLVHGAASYGAAWCADASATTGAAMAYTDRASGAVLLLAVNKRVYAVSYGDGHRLIRDELKDQRFGLRFAVRQLDADRIHWLVHRMPGGRRRQDSILVPDGLPIWCYWLDGYASVVGHIGGELKQADLTFCRDGTRQVRINGLGRARRAAGRAARRPAGRYPRSR